MEPLKIPWQIKVEKSSDFLPVLWRFGQCLADVEIRFKAGVKRKASDGPPEPLLAHSLALMGLNGKFYEQISSSDNNQRNSGNASSKRTTSLLTSPSYSNTRSTTVAASSIGLGFRPLIILYAQEGVSRESFQFFLEYIYFVKSGEDITESVATGLLDLAKEYDCHRLVLDLENFFIRTLNQRNLPERYEIGRTFDFHHLVLKCLNMASSCLALFEEPELRRRISKDLMNDLLAMDQLPLDEEKLFEFFLQWSSEVIPSDSTAVVQSSLKRHIRFPAMPVDFLATKVDPSGVLTKEELLNVAFDAACSATVPKRSGFPSRKRKLVSVVEATSAKLGRFSVECDSTSSVTLRSLKDKFAVAMAQPADVLLFQFDMKDGAFRKMWNSGMSQSQINVDDIELDLIDASSLKLVVMTTIIAESSVPGGMTLTLRLQPDASVGHMQTQASQELRVTSPSDVPPASVIFVTADGTDVYDGKLSLRDVNIRDGDVIKYKLLKFKCEQVSFDVTDMTGDKTTFKMKRSTPLKKLKDAYAVKYNIREEERPCCRFLYHGNRINDDDSPDSLGIDDGDTIEFFWELCG